MYLFKKVSDLQHFLNETRKSGRQIGFAPTMGALHKGHVSLVERAKRENLLCVASIFINPTQFNDPKDLERYPRTIEKDIELLVEAGCDALFLPDVSEIYPAGYKNTLSLDFGKLDKILEGEFRPGHFDGMAQVVSRLLDIVQPDKLYMGQKDFQQFTVVQSMLKQTDSKIGLEMCDIIRESDGLAMSSRNTRLSADARAVAPSIHEALKHAQSLFVERHSPKEIQEAIVKTLKTIPQYKLEYFEIVDGISLLPIRTFTDSEYVVALTAIWVGDVRLIDNIILKKKVSVSTDEE
jgi:pantoate--beta-alanine ligase